VTFAREDDAKSAIKSVHGFWVDNCMIKASFGTTKYCNMFLRGLSCTNPDCLYLHKLGDTSSSFTKVSPFPFYFYFYFYFYLYFLSPIQTLFIL